MTASVSPVETGGHPTKPHDNGGPNAQYVGIDLHRRQSVIYRMDHAGDKIDSVRVDNEPSRFAKEVSAAPVGSAVILEATYGWYWAADLLKEMGYRVHLGPTHKATAGGTGG